MPQALLPLIPAGATPINDRISVVRENEEWAYFCGIDPIFRHPEKDQQSFRMFTAQLVCQGACQQVDIIRAFGVSTQSVRRNVKKYREEGIAAFFRPRQGRGPTVMTDTITLRAQELLSRGCSRCEVADTSHCLHHVSQVPQRGVARGLLPLHDGTLCDRPA